LVVVLIPASSSTVIPGGPADVPASDGGVPEPAIEDLADLPVPPKCPYVGWSYYFPPSLFGEGNKPPATCVPVFVKYFQARLYNDYDVKAIVKTRVFEVSVSKLCEDAGTVDHRKEEFQVMGGIA
jgi:hypothetical protein